MIIQCGIKITTFYGKSINAVCFQFDNKAFRPNFTRKAKRPISLEVKDYNQKNYDHNL